MSMAIHSPEIYTSFEEEYKTIREGIGVAHRLESEFIFLTGKDVLDFLNRLSTNEVLDLRANQLRSTVLTTEKGKFVDFITIIPYGNGYLLEGGSPTVSEWLRKFIVLEDVTINSLSHEISKVSLFGPKALSVLKMIGFSEPRDPQELQGVFLNGIDVMLGLDSLFPDPVWNLYCKKGQVEELLFQFDAFSEPIIRVGGKAFECFRIEQGVPKPGKELTESLNPLEAGLQRFVSFTKGCYIGQEVIARLNTYDKLQRILTGFKGQFEDQIGDIYQQDHRVGWTASHCYSPFLGQHIALGFLSTNIDKRGLVLKIENGLEYPISVIDMPIRINGKEVNGKNP